jgi:hypothetical protein
MAIIFMPMTMSDINRTAENDKITVVRGRERIKGIEFFVTQVIVKGISIFYQSNKVIRIMRAENGN